MVNYTFRSDKLKPMYYTPNYPHFTLCDIIWGSAASMHLDPVIKLQKDSYQIFFVNLAIFTMLIFLNY